MSKKKTLEELDIEKVPFDKNVFPSLTLQYIDVPCCPVCGALPVAISITCRHSHRINGNEEAKYACGLNIIYEDGGRRVYNECDHLKDIMSQMLQKGITTEEMLTSGSPFQHVVARVRTSEAERRNVLEKVRKEKLDKERRKTLEEGLHHKQFYGLE
jgi:hypothetical protein